MTKLTLLRFHLWKFTHTYCQCDDTWSGLDYVGLCENMRPPIDGEKLLAHLRNVSFVGKDAFFSLLANL